MVGSELSIFKGVVLLEGMKGRLCFYEYFSDIVISDEMGGVSRGREWETNTSMHLDSSRGVRDGPSRIWREK